jgi:hypothetical protein
MWLPCHVFEHLEDVEDEIHLERNIMPDWEIDEAITNWVLNVGNSRGRDTKYWKTVYLYWHLKMLLGQMLQTKEEAQDKILLQLDELHLLVKEVLARLPPSSSAMAASVPKSAQQVAPEPPQDPNAVSPD